MQTVASAEQIDSEQKPEHKSDLRSRLLKDRYTKTDDNMGSRFKQPLSHADSDGHHSA